MGAEGVDLPADRRADVDPHGGLVRPEEVNAPNLVRREAVAREPRESHRVPGGRVDRVDGGHAGRAVIGVVDSTVVVEEDVGIGRQDGVWTERANLANEHLAQDEVVDERAVRLMEERDARVTDDRRRGPLLAESGELERIGLRILAALVAARAAHEPALRARVDPSGGCRGWSEVGVVGVRGDHHEPLRAPVVRGLGAFLGGVRSPADGRRLVAHRALRGGHPGSRIRLARALLPYDNAAEASLVSPHERSLVFGPARLVSGRAPSLRERPARRRAPTAPRPRGPRP